MLDDKALLQVYFYKTYLYQQSVKKSVQYRSTKSTEGNMENTNQNRYKGSFDWFYMHSPELFNLFLQLQKAQQGNKARAVVMSKNGRKSALKAFSTVSFRKGSRIKPSPLKQLRANTVMTARPQSSVTMYNQFFTYFFLHFFKMQAIILAKSLYKAVTANALFKHEHQVLLYRTRFLKWHKWSFDFLFLANYALTFSNMNFVLPFYLTHVVRKYKQFKYAELFFNILRKLYFYKRNIRAIKVLINGPYNRHGRTHFRILRIGDLALSQSQSCVMYDAIQWLTPYGAVSLKLWVYYADYLIAK